MYDFMWAYFPLTFLSEPFIHALIYSSFLSVTTDLFILILLLITVIIKRHSGQYLTDFPRELWDSVCLLADVYNFPSRFFVASSMYLFMCPYWVMYWMSHILFSHNLICTLIIHYVDLTTLMGLWLKTCHWDGKPGSNGIKDIGTGLLSQQIDANTVSQMSVCWNRSQRGLCPSRTAGVRSFT